MAFGDPSNPTRFGRGQSAPPNDRALFLDVFGGEVLAAFEQANIFEPYIRTLRISGGMRSARFPKTWKATAEYHQPGQELLGNTIDTGEIIITPDELLVSHVAVSDIDEMLSHFEVRSRFAAELGAALARVHDQNIARALVLAARTPADGPFPSGAQVVDPALAPNAAGVYDGQAIVQAIRAANRIFYDRDVPESYRRYCALPRPAFDALRFAVDPAGRYLFVERDFGATQTFSERRMMLEVDGVSVMPTKHVPSTNQSTDTSIYSKYRANYTNTRGIVWCEDAVGAVTLRAPTLETTRDVRRQETFMVASLLSGLGTLRPECAVELRSAAL